MKRILLLSSAAIALMGGSAFAQAFNFNGFYAGAQGGYVFGDKTWDIGPGYDHTVNGFLAGAQLGFNLQQGTVVFGAEIDWNWTNFAGSVACGGSTCSIDGNWLASATARVGAALGVAMIYAEAGFGIANETAAIDGATDYAGTWSNTGWTFGGGVEVGLAPGWTIDLEYGFWMLGTDTVTLDKVPGPGTTLVDITQTMHTIRLGVNFLF